MATEANGGSAYLQRLEEAERRKELLKKQSRPVPNDPGGGGSSHREKRKAKNGTYLVMIITCLLTTVALNVMHHSLSGGGAHDASYQTAEAFVRTHFKTAMDVIEDEVHQIEGMLGGDGDGDEYADRSGQKPLREGGLKPWLKDRRPDGEKETKKNRRDERERADDTHKGGTDSGGGAAKRQGRNHKRGGAKAAGGHSLAGLSCEKHGGPSDVIAEEMVYWSDIPTDSDYVSPFKEEGVVKYMTFEPDGGGWNNIRMAMETVVGLAHATGRTLVMPPEQKMYLLGKGKREHKKTFGFCDFYHTESLSDEHMGLDIITTEEFLVREAMTGRLFNKTSGKASFPPGNRTNWDGSTKDQLTPLKEWLREVTYTPFWKPDRCMAAFPSSRGPEEIKHLQEMNIQIKTEAKTDLKDADNGLPSVDAPAIDRMRENLVDRELCVYDEEMQAAQVIHFMCYHKMRVRLLVHFYVFLFFEEWTQDLWNKRFIRDHLRYRDEMQCAAARVVDAIRTRARARNPDGNPDGLWDSMHVRRGDFQYKRTRVDADVLYEESRNELTEDATIFVSTDEHNRTFFGPLAKHYDICFLDDFKHLFEDMNPNLFGMLDQLIASKGRVFYGTFHSTFTGFINRMRGYYIDKHKLPGHKEGTMASYYFVPAEKKMDMRKYAPIRQPYFAREFPVAWRGINEGIDEIAAGL